MKTVYLLRHAHAESASPPRGGDHERPLSKQGEREALALGAWLRDEAISPDAIFSSSSVRTTQTVRLAFGDERHAIFDHALYQASAGKLLGIIKEADEQVNSLLIVCHNPGATELALLLAQDETDGRLSHLAPATFVQFNAHCRSWRDFSPDLARVVRVFVPEN